MNYFTARTSVRFTSDAHALLLLAFAALFTAWPTHAATPAGIDQAAPVVSRHDIDIDAPLAAAWAFQTNIAAWTQWRPTVTAARFDGRLAVGSPFNWEEGGLQITSTVREFVPPRRYYSKCEMCRRRKVAVFLL